LRILRSSGQILEAALVPLLVLVGAGIGWLTHRYRDVGPGRRTRHHRVSGRAQSPLALVQKIFAVAVAALASVGALVVAVKMLAH
jgi:hypothetical protein